MYLRGAKYFLSRTNFCDGFVRELASAGDCLRARNSALILFLQSPNATKRDLLASHWPRWSQSDGGRRLFSRDFPDRRGERIDFSPTNDITCCNLAALRVRRGAIVWKIPRDPRAIRIRSGIRLHHETLIRIICSVTDGDRCCVCARENERQNKITANARRLNRSSDCCDYSFD